MRKIKYLFLIALVSLFMPNVVKAEGFKVGDYVEVVPTKSTYTIDKELLGRGVNQTINPSELKLWRIIKINSDGSFDAVSEYTSSTDVWFNAKSGYAKYVGTLQTIAQQYENSTFTTGSRMMGYDGQTLTLTDLSAFDETSTTAPSTTSTPTPITGTGQEYGGGLLGDTLYLKDIQLVGNVYKSDSSTYGDTGLKAYKVNDTSSSSWYWLASRRYYYDSSNSGYSFSFNGIDNDGVLTSAVTIYNYNGWGGQAQNSWLRPILTLKSGLLIESGEGTKNSPYKLKVADSKTEEDTKTEEKITEESKIETKVNEDVAPKETVKNPKTGNNISYISGLIFVIISGLGLVLLKNKRLLNK